MMKITVQELVVRLEKKDLVLIDVREPYETEICTINGSVFIPMGQIQNKKEDLDLEKSYAIICHSGVRSQAVTNFLVQLGFDAVNVIGGIDMWAVEIDKKMIRY